MPHDSKPQAAAPCRHRVVVLLSLVLAPSLVIELSGNVVHAAGGELNLTVRDESTGQRTIARVELSRTAAVIESNRRPARTRVTQPMAIARTVSAGWGAVLDGSINLSLADGAYEFRLTRGLESRVMTGNFLLERTSRDDHVLTLPRIANLRANGWTSGDCLVPPSSESLVMRMAAEDLHLAMRLGPPEGSDAATSWREKPVPGRQLPDSLGWPEQTSLDDSSQPDWPLNPIFIGNTARLVGGLAFYPVDADAATRLDQWLIANPGRDRASVDEQDLRATACLVARRNGELGDAGSVRVAIENPLASALPVWLAHGPIDGIFVLGDWLRPDRPVMQMLEAHVLDSGGHRDATSLGREVEQVYWKLLDAGIPVVPLAGSGDQADSLPVGSNRLYVAGSASGRLAMGDGVGETPVAVSSAADWWSAAWAGRSVATNGPLLQPMLGGRLPGQTFELRDGDSISLTPELLLTTRDPVDYLEVIHNGNVHYSARLNEYARAGGQIPPLKINESGWAVIRVVTRFEGYFRAAMSAPWRFRFGAEERVDADAVQFFRDWLVDHETRLKQQRSDSLARHVTVVRAARDFWQTPPRTLGDR